MNRPRKTPIQFRARSRQPDDRRPPTPEPHTNAWDKQSLGLIETSVLRKVWPPVKPDSVTDD